MTGRHRFPREGLIQAAHEPEAPYTVQQDDGTVWLVWGTELLALIEPATLVRLKTRLRAQVGGDVPRLGYP